MNRYIDADKVIEQLNEYLDEYSWVNEEGLHDLKWCAMMEALAVVEETPVEDVVTIRYGQWYSDSKIITQKLSQLDKTENPIYREGVVYYCSNCCRKTVIRENYCPSCGAKMI